MMSVLEYALDIKRDVSLVISVCKKLGIDVDDENSMLDDEAIVILDNEFSSNEEELEEDDSEDEFEHDDFELDSEVMDEYEDISDTAVPRSPKISGKSSKIPLITSPISLPISLQSVSSIAERKKFKMPFTIPEMSFPRCFQFIFAKDWFIKSPTFWPKLEKLNPPSPSSPYKNP